MQACFELPTLGDSADKFNKVRRFWNELRDNFKAAVTCSWIMCLEKA